MKVLAKHLTVVATKLRRQWSEQTDGRTAVQGSDHRRILLGAKKSVAFIVSFVVCSKTFAFSDLTSKIDGTKMFELTRRSDNL